MTLTIDVAAAFTASGAARFDVDVSFTVDRGETVVVLGPSGSGKTLLLETVAGFHSHDGTVHLDGTDVSANPPEERDFGFVFQEYALFPHLTVTENVAYGGRYRETSMTPGDLLTNLGVAHLADRYPPTLSGGEKQRVALARSLFVDPAVLLLDEPLSALDVPTKESLRRDMLDMLDDATAVYVTHDRTTARTLADRIVVMNEGTVVQRGTPSAIFHRPASPFVARFTGSNTIEIDRSAVRDAIDAPRGATHLAVRPEDVRLNPPEPAFTATVDRIVREDAAYRVTLTVGRSRLDAFTGSLQQLGGSIDAAVGEPVGVSFDAAAATYFSE